LGPILTGWDYYLAGGTALALQLGHRKSVDLDWFTSEPMGSPRQKAAALLRAGVPFKITFMAQGTLHGTVSRVRVSLLDYGYRQLRPAIRYPGCSCQLASLPDVAAMKLAAVADRGAKKDFVDLWALLQIASVTEMLKWYKEKYAVDDVGHVLYSMTYFQDADRDRMPQMLWRVRWSEMKRAVRERVEEFNRLRQEPRRRS
jgi:hypothetical protein